MWVKNKKEFVKNSHDKVLHKLSETGIIFNEKKYEVIYPFQIPFFCKELGFRKIKGLRSIYFIEENHIYLKTLQFRLPEGENYPVIGEVNAVDGYNILENFFVFFGIDDGKVYENINSFAKFSGTVLVGSEPNYDALMIPSFDDDYTNHYWEYKELLLLEFSEGILTNKKDVSGMDENKFNEICKLVGKLTKATI